MNRTTKLSIAALLALLMLCASAAQAQTTAFTYQGRLNESGSPATGSYDLQFKLFDALTDGAQIGATNSLTNVTVTGGVFSVQLDFGVFAFPGANRWLEISVRLAGDEVFTTLTPLQPVTATPYAIKSLTATAADSLSAACAACVTSSQINNITSSQINGTISGSQLSIPLSLSGSSANPILSATNTGAGFGLQGASASSSGVGVSASAYSATGFTYGVSGGSASSSGTGVYGLATSTTGVTYGVLGASVSSDGTGVRGLHYTTSGTAPGVEGISNSTDESAVAVLGTITSTSPATASAGVRGKNNGTGILGLGVYGSHAGAGWGVLGTSISGIGVRGQTTALTGDTFGVYGQIYSSNGAGVFGRSFSSTGTNYGVHGLTSSLSGAGVRAQGVGISGTALQIEDGAIRVPGAGVGTSTTVFIHQATAANTNFHVTRITHPMTDGDPNVMLIVTTNWNPGGAGGTYNNHAIGVYYDFGSNKWTIFNQDLVAMPVNAAFNVLIVKP